MPRARVRTLTLLLGIAVSASAPAQPVISYTISVHVDDLSGFGVAIRVRNAPDTFRVAMPAHQEYDERFWRHVEDLRVETPGGVGSVAREDSAVWRVVARGGEGVIRYRIRVPAGPDAGRRGAWRPFLASSGGLIGGPYGIMYVVGAEPSPARVTLELPSDWDIATGLEPTSDPRTFLAASADVLAESPLLLGRLRSWRFAIDGLQHRVAFWPLPNAAPFDTAAFIGGIERVARQALTLFGRAPYRDYFFLIQDGAYGGLEHPNSVTLGVSSTELAGDPYVSLGELAHEFVHTWNLMSIRPAEYRRVDYRTQPPTAGLWWSEGLTIFYADLFLRRAALPVPDSTRITHLEGLITRYLSSPGNARFSAERVSQVAYNAPPGSLGDYGASTHLQGELLGAMLDLSVRQATDGRRSIDDVMRAMFERFSGARGFTGRDIEQSVENVCGCDVTSFFDAHVRGGTPIEFDRYLGAIGLRARITWSAAQGRDGTPAPDMRISAWEPPNETNIRLLVSNPSSVWGRAGLHSGDQLVAVNDAPVLTWLEFRTLVGRLRIADTVHVDVARPTGRFRATVLITGFDRPFVRIQEDPQATPAQYTLRAKWLAGR